MFTLENASLMHGDVVLTAQDAVVSRKIRKATGSDFSHAILYVGDGSYIHSDSEGVHASNTQRLLIENPANVQVYRLIVRDSQAIQKICEYARSEIGKQYSVSEAIKSTLRRRTSSPTASNRQFCSRLVAQAYAYAGILLVSNPDYCYPQDIGNSNLLHRVEGCITKATVIDLRIAASDNPLQRQAHATNFILAEARRFSGKDIQNFNQLTQHLLQDGRYDKEISEAVRKSGYLDLWQYDCQKNSWRYDPVKFLNLNISREEMLKLAKSELATAELQLGRFKFMYQHYTQLWQIARRHYFKQELQLYRTLIEWAQLRVTIATHVLSNA